MGDSFARWLAVWRRNALAWRKSAGTALLGGIAEPLFNLFALGYGLGSLIQQVEGQSYLGFLASGILATSAMNAATFEGLYLAFTRMEVQRSWDALLAAPLDIRDVFMGELLWLATKSLFSACLILVITSVLGLTSHWTVLAIPFVAFCAGLAFGAMALMMTSFARSYDFFVYYVTLAITPMVLLSGVFFPLSALPQAPRALVASLPLYHVVEVVRPLLAGRLEPSMLGHLAVPLAYAAAAGSLAVWRLRRRLLQ